MSEPLEAPSVQARVSWALPLVTEVMVGADGTTAVGVKLTGLDGDPAPRLLMAVTVTEYAVPPVNPVIVVLSWLAETDVVIAGPLGGATATEYEAIEPSPELGSVHASDTEPIPVDEETMLGAWGSVAPLITDTEAPPILAT